MNARIEQAVSELSSAIVELEGREDDYPRRIQVEQAVFAFIDAQLKGWTTVQTRPEGL